MDIQVLDDNTINKIAAGEVIERPASALKELLENAADSGATRIDVSFDEGGKNLIKVVDNGSGIKPEQLRLALQRHATSKLKKIEDLNSIQTLGFRGEALASMGAVSELTLSSGTKGSAKGAKIKASGGKLSEVEPAASIEGTQVEVKNLFYNVPARQKFLKSSSGETAAIKKVFKNFALIHPEITVSLKQDQKQVFVYPKQDFFSRACDVLEVKKQDCFYLNETVDDMNLEAVLVHPKLNMATLMGLYIFVQTRPVQDKLIQQAVLEGYRNLVMEHQYPQAVVSLKVNPEFVDVNTHPSKLQVKFQNSSTIFKFINQSIKKVFESNLEKTINPVRVSFEQADIQPSFINEAPTQYNQKTFYNHQQGIFIPSEVSSVVNTAEPIKETKVHTWSSMQVIGQFANTYIVAQSQKGLLLIDQHAAHERVLFERLKNKSKIEKQASLIEELVELAPEKIEALLQENIQHALQNLGFEFYQRSPTHLALSTKPTFLLDVGMQNLFDRLSEQVLDAGSHSVLEDIITDVWASMSCHGAIRAGKVLSKEEMQALLVQMEENSFSSFCPHGRPVSVLLTQYDLEKLFKRIV